MEIPFEIDKEFDNRYEGFDYDDVDERRRQSPVVESDDNEEEENAELPSPPSHPDEITIFEDLERAEEEYERQQAKKRPGARLLEKLESKKTKLQLTTTTTTADLASRLIQYHRKIASALVTNTTINAQKLNHNALASRIALQLAPQPSRSLPSPEDQLSTVLARINRAKTVQELEKEEYTIGDTKCTPPLAKSQRIEENIDAIAAALSSSSSSSQSSIIRQLFQLSAMRGITADVLGSPPNKGTMPPGKRLNALKKQLQTTKPPGSFSSPFSPATTQLIIDALSIVITSWKTSIRLSSS